MQIVLDKVYEMAEAKPLALRDIIAPTFVVEGSGAIDVYVSNSSTQPANVAAMTLDDSALTAGSYPVVARCKYIAFSLNGATAANVYEDSLVK